jgi:glyoxylase-like metal-dependent hydrolase (beta-lactamase superfamily II)
VPIATNLRQIVPRLWSWHAYDPQVRVDLFSCGLESEAGLVLVDPIALDEVGRKTLSSHGTVHAIVVTNANHARQSAEFKKCWNVPILAHRDALRELEIPVDGFLQAGDSLGGGIQVLELPGAGAGEIALYDQSGRIHFGDAVVNLESTGLCLLPEKYCSDPAQLKKSVAALSGLKAGVITFAHGLPLVKPVEAGLDLILSLAR